MKHLANKQFVTDTDTKQVVSFYAKIQDLEPHCLNGKGDNVEVDVYHLQVMSHVYHSQIRFLTIKAFIFFFFNFPVYNSKSFFSSTVLNKK
jgi:hypothetical protein